MRYGQYQIETGIVRACTIQFNLKRHSRARDCAGMYYSVQPENSVIRVQGSLKPTYAHTGKFEQILCYRCDVVRMVHEQHDAPCFGQRVEWSRYGQYQFEMVIVRARTVQFNLKIASFACKGA